MFYNNISTQFLCLTTLIVRTVIFLCLKIFIVRIVIFLCLKTKDVVHYLTYNNKGAFNYYVIRLGGVESLDQNNDNYDASRGEGGKRYSHVFS